MILAKYDSGISLINLTGIKSVKLKENQLIFEFAFRWAGNPNIAIALELLSLKIPVQVRARVIFELHFISKHINLFTELNNVNLHYMSIIFLSVDRFSNMCKTKSDFGAFVGNLPVLFKHYSVTDGKGKQNCI